MVRALPYHFRNSGSSPCSAKLVTKYGVRVPLVTPQKASFRNSGQTKASLPKKVPLYHYRGDCSTLNYFDSSQQHICPGLIISVVTLIVPLKYIMLAWPQFSSFLPYLNAISQPDCRPPRSPSRQIMAG